MITDGTDFYQSERNVFRITVDNFKFLINFLIQMKNLVVPIRKCKWYSFRVG